MRTVLIIILFFAGKALDGQTSFSAFKIDNYSSNIFQEFITVNDSSIIVKSQHFCNHHNGNILYECNVLTELDSKLQINHTHFVNEFISNCQNCIIKEKENFILLGKSLDEQLNQTSVDLKIFSNVFELISTDSIGLHVNPEHLNLRGLIRDTLRNSYIYGDKRDGNNSRSIQITKLDYLNNNIASYSIKRGVINEPFDLQFDRNGNLIISNKYFSQIGGSGEFGVQYVLLDSNLTLIDSFEYLNITEHPTVFLAHSNNFMFNTTKNHPDSFSLPSQGRINKYTETFDSLLWSIELPFDNFTNARKYKILDFEEGANGDILACGSVWDEEDDGPLQNSNNHVYNGFAVRVDQNGDIKWLRLYKIENDNPMLPKEEYGKFLQGGLTQIEELDNGQILMGGSIYHTPRQLSTIVSSSETRNYIWTMITNEQGCLDDIPCEEIIRLNSKTDLDYNIGDQWIFEEEFGIGGGIAEIGYKPFEIQDSVYDGVYTKYVLDAQDTFYIENDQMYFWSEYFQEYIMHFDFNSTTEYNIKYFDQFRDSEEIATVKIDSVSYKKFGSDSIKVQHVNVLNSGTFEDYYVDVYEGIGASAYHITFVLGCGLCDDNPYITKLRCFSNEIMTYQFVPYECDSTWISTSVEDLSNDKFYIYPNPTSGEVFIDELERNIKFQIYNLEGRLIQKGVTKNKLLFIDNKGISILKLYINNKWLTRKVIVLE